MGDRRVRRESVLAFRAAAQSLDARRPASDLLEVVGACGIQDTPPGNADVALVARLDIDGPVVRDAVEERRLALTWSVRGAPHLVPPRDLPVFTLGASPAEGTREGLWGQPEDALVEVERAMVAALGPQPRGKGEVSEAVTGSVPPELAPWCRACQVNHPSESVFRAAPLLGRIVLTSTAPVMLAKAGAWLGADAQGDLQELRTELLVRYLRCYAPSTSGQFAEWAGIAKPDAKERWSAIAHRLVPVDVGRRAFALQEDLEALEHPPPCRGVRLIPAKDAFLQARDRDLLFPDTAVRKRVFPMLGGPGVVLHEAVPFGTWRGAAKGRRYAVTVEPFARFDRRVGAELEVEAERVARVRGHQGADLVLG